MASVPSPVVNQQSVNPRWDAVAARAEDVDSGGGLNVRDGFEPRTRAIWCPTGLERDQPSHNRREQTNRRAKDQEGRRELSIETDPSN